VSSRQRGNPVLGFLKTQPWEYSDIPADYVIGATTCALFLSLKYHRLHPEYIYTRIRNLQGKYSLRILLTMVDIPNHEDALRELSKTSVINNVTVMLCWSAAEAARYLELYKSYEHSGFAAIKGQQTSSYAERLIEFVTVPRSINKADAVALVSNFGSLRNAVNGDADEIGLIGGWGGVKVKRWCGAVQEPFRAKNAAARRADPVYAPDPKQLEPRSNDGRDERTRDSDPSCDEPKNWKQQLPPERQEQEQVSVSSPKPGRGHNVTDGDVELTGPVAEPAAPESAPPEAAAPTGAPALAPGITAALAKLRERG
jgi:DNA excision repair protein ERCC-1